MVTYEHSETDASVVVDIVLLIAERRSVDPGQLPPIEESIDPDALDSLFASARANGSQEGYVEFTYCDHQVTVPLDGDRTITVTDSSSATSQETGPSAS